MQLSHRIDGRTLVLGFGFIASLICGCDLPIPDAEKEFKGKDPPASFTYTIRDRTIHYMVTGRPDKRTVLFIHGTPGSWDNFSPFLADEKLQENARLIAVDRPGFGASDYGNIVLSLQKQAELLRPLLAQKSSSGGVILVGHSIGASLAVRLAMDYPDQICGLVLIGPSVDPDLEKPRWFNRLAASGAVHWAVPKAMMMANEEVMALEKELNKMKPLWGRIRVPVIVIQGEKDKLVFPENADFAERMLIHADKKIIRVPGAGHFVLWKQPHIVRTAIRSMLDSGCGNRL